MRSSHKRILWSLALWVAVAVLLSCDQSGTCPTAPVAIRGSITLELATRGSDCASGERQRLIPLDSVCVYLLRDGSFLDSTFAVDGKYEFLASSCQEYQTAIGVWPCLADTSAVFRPAADVVLPDTLVLRRTGTIFSCPNPGDPWSGGIRFRYIPDQTGYGLTAILTLDGSAVDTIAGPSHMQAGATEEFFWGYIGGPPPRMPPGYYLIAEFQGPGINDLVASAFEVVLFEHEARTTACIAGPGTPLALTGVVGAPVSNGEHETPLEGGTE